MLNDAMLALQDCLMLSTLTGNYVCREAASANIQLLEAQRSVAPIIRIPINDKETGWQLTIDPFAVWILPPAYMEGSVGAEYGSGLHSRGTWSDE
jgi:hypothetical protein